MDGSKLKQKKKRGFTLIELLAVIAILAIVGVLIIFTATNVIGKARAKGYLASISNIEKESSSYAIENTSSIRWISTDDNNGEYYCVTVKDLMDIGFFDKDVLESEIDKNVFVQENDYIYLERDINTKTVTKSILIAGKNSNIDYCDEFKTDGIISFSTATGWSNNKDVVIDYYILNFKGNVDDYEYYYMREDTGEEVRGKFNNSSSMSIKVEKFKAEEIVARIYYQNMKIVERTFKTKIDKVKPSLELLVNNGTSYMKGNDVYISLVDNESGFKRGKHRVYYKWSLNDLTCNEIISNGDYVELSVDANNLNKSNPELIYLNNNNGKGKIYACSDSVYDYVGNKLDGVYSADIYLDNDKPIISLGNYEKTDKAYTSTKIELLVSDKTSGVKDGSFTKEDLVVYVGDKILDTSNLTLTKKDDEGKYELVINNKAVSGDVTVVVKENSVEDIAGNKNDEYTFKPEITFVNAYVINYNANGGTGSMTSTGCFYGESCTLKTNSFTRTGYTFLGWSKSSNATTQTYNDKHTFNNYNNTEDITLYAVWKVNKVTIKYHVNGGSIATSSNDNGTWTVNNSLVYRDGTVYTTIINYGDTINSSGLTNYNNADWVNVSKRLYIAKSGEEWICEDGCSIENKTYNQNTNTYKASDFCDASNGDCTVTLKINWEIADKTPPICNLSISTEGENVKLVADKIEDENEITYSGWSSSYSGDSSTSMTVSSEGTYTYYVMDEVGNKGSCSADVSVTSQCTPSGLIGTISYFWADYYGKICFDRTYIPDIDKSAIKITSFKVSSTNNPAGIMLWVDGMIYINGVPAQLCNSYDPEIKCSVVFSNGEGKNNFHDVDGISFDNNPVLISGNTINFSFKNTGLSGDTTWYKRCDSGNYCFNNIQYNEYGEVQIKEELEDEVNYTSGSFDAYTFFNHSYANRKFSVNGEGYDSSSGKYIISCTMNENGECS